MAPRPTVLLTRPETQSLRFAADLRRRFGPVSVVLSPVLRIVPRRGPVPLADVAAVVLTSENGARALAAAADVAGMRAYCVGDRTAKVATAAGMRAVSARGDADDLVALVAAERPGGRVLFAHGAETRGRVAERLRAAGVAVDSVVLYDRAEQPPTAGARALLDGAAPVVLPVFSPRSAALAARMAACARAPLWLAALSPAVDAAWTGPAPARRVVADRPDAKALLDAMQALFPKTAP